MTIGTREEHAYTLGVQAGLWGYPLAHRVEAFPRALRVKGIALNSFQKFERLKTADDRFVVTPNNLTIDAYAIYDVPRGPVVVHVPTLAEPRWYIVQSGDAFDDVILNLGGNRPAVPGAYVITGPDHRGRVPGDMIEVRSRTTVGFLAVRIGVTGSGDLDGAAQAQQGVRVVPLHRYLTDGIAGAEIDHGPIGLPELTAPDDRVLFDRIGAVLSYMFPVSADVDDTFIQALATIGPSVGRGFDWQSLSEATLAGLRRAAPVIEQIVDERWATMSVTGDGWRGSLATGRCSYDWGLNAANTKNQVGTELPTRSSTSTAGSTPTDNRSTGPTTTCCASSPATHRRSQPCGTWPCTTTTCSSSPTTPTDSRSATPPTASPPDPDGSLTIHIQNRAPEGDRATNRLPAPAGPFNLTTRYYSPLTPVLDKSYAVPPVRRA